MPPVIESVDFGFLVCQVIHFYSQDYNAVLNMPLKLFWTLCNNIQRIQARNDLRQLSIASTSAIAGGMSGSVESLQNLHEALATERGVVIKAKFDPIREAVLDRSGLERLRQLSSK